MTVIDPVFTVCEICGALIGRAGLHAEWHNPEPEPELEPEPENESENDNG